MREGENNDKKKLTIIYNIEIVLLFRQYCVQIHTLYPFYRFHSKNTRYRIGLHSESYLSKKKNSVTNNENSLRHNTRDNVLETHTQTIQLCFSSSFRAHSMNAAQNRYHCVTFVFLFLSQFSFHFKINSTTSKKKQFRLINTGQEKSNYF